MLKKIHKNKEKDKENRNRQSDFEAKQNLLGFFDLLLKIDKRNNIRGKNIITINLFFKISVSIVFIIFAMWFIFQNECFYSLVCLILLFLIVNNQKLKKLTIKRDSFSVEFFNPEKYKNKIKKIRMDSIKNKIPLSKYLKIN